MKAEHHLADFLHGGRTAEQLRPLVFHFTPGEHRDFETALALLGQLVACLCLSIGACTPTDALDRVFGSASHANAATLAALSARMDQLFLAAVKELAAPNPSARRGP